MRGMDATCSLGINIAALCSGYGKEWRLKWMVLTETCVNV